MLNQSQNLHGVKQYSNRKLTLEITTNETDIKQSQRLRHQIFSSKAAIHHTDRALDVDHFDHYCFHLIVRDYRTREIVASTRILTDQMARLAGGYYSETEFQLNNILNLQGRSMEIGRTCVHPDYRDGAAITLLWKGLSRFMVLHEFEYLFGCASIGMEDGGNQARIIMDYLRDNHMSNEQLRVTPRYGLPPLDNVLSEILCLPPLLKSYLRLGAKVCSEPCWDETFNVADVFVLLNINELEPRYARRFIGEFKSPAVNTVLASSSMS